MTSTSEISDTEDGTKPSANSSPNPGSGGMAFLVHSQDTVGGNMPPDVDNKSLARQKRRRTSPEDQKILEAEFQRNPKPDKVARLDIVSRVALGEKEVQIWFQNRRQNSRRRSRPLDAEENLLQLYPTSDGSTMEATERDEDNEEGTMLDEREVADPRAAKQAEKEKGSHGEVEEFKRKTVDSQSSDDTAASDATKVLDSQETLPTQVDSTQTLRSSQDVAMPSTGGPGYLANRRSASFIRSQESSFISVTDVLPSSTPVRSSRALRRSISYLRLSMSDDGHAQIIDRAAKSPSPQKIVDMMPRSVGLRRSFSAAGLNERLKQANTEEGARKLPRTSAIGRSRDSRAWEFWCDSEARNSLVSKADQETSGSAVDAIGQIVANNKALRANASRRNLPIGSQNGGNRAALALAKPIKPTLQRSSTSHGRLQSKPQIPQTQAVDKKKASEGDEWEQLATESDKENWEPDVPTQPRSQTQRRLKQSHTARRVLGENTQMMSQSSSLGAMMVRERRSKQNVATIEILDDEVASFMGGASGNDSNNRASTSSGEELDCVQSLLSLSKGNWR